MFSRKMTMTQVTFVHITKRANPPSCVSWGTSRICLTPFFKWEITSRRSKMNWCYYMGLCPCPYYHLKLSSKLTRLDDLSKKIIRRPYWKTEHGTFRLQSTITNWCFFSNRSSYAKQQPRKNYFTSMIIRRCMVSCLYHYTHVKETYASSLNMSM